MSVPHHPPGPVTWRLRTTSLPLPVGTGDRRPLVMGIVNVTPDSFSDGGRHADVEAAVAHGLALVADGADLLDVGGESTRPYSTPVDAEEEWRRVGEVVHRLAREAGVPVSIDTSKAVVAAQAIAAGAEIINDVTGLEGDPNMVRVAVESGAAVCAMHMQGTPQTMQAAPHYDDVVAEVRAYFHQRLEALAALGIAPQRIVFDPGIGFGKTDEHNLALLRHLDQLAPAGRPLLLGVSRKSFIGRVLGADGLAGRSAATVALTSHARALGVRILRVHEAAPNLHALRITEAILGV